MPGSNGNVTNLVGQTLAGALVLKRVSNSPEGNAAWECRLACGCVAIVEGIRLRSDERLGRTIRCKACRERRLA